MMSCDNEQTRSQLVPIRLRHWRHHDRPAPVIGFLHTQTMVGILLLRAAGYVEACDSWMVRADAWREDIMSRRIDLTHWHYRQGSRRLGTYRDMIYRIATESFNRVSHSSYVCTDAKHEHAEMLHCGKQYFSYERDREPSIPAAAQQGVLSL